MNQSEFPATQGYALTLAVQDWYQHDLYPKKLLRISGNYVPVTCAKCGEKTTRTSFYRCWCCFSLVEKLVRWFFKPITKRCNRNGEITPFPQRRNFFVIPVPFEINCCCCFFFFLSLFFFLRNRAKFITSQKWNKTSGGFFTGIIFSRVKRRQQAFALRHDRFSCIQLYYWSKYLF